MSSLGEAVADDDDGFIEPVSNDAPIIESDFAVTSDYDPTVDDGSEVWSVSSSVYAHAHENGRRYHVYKYGRYPIPNDEEEDYRESLRHSMFLELLDGRLFLAPIGPSPHRILDLGTGFGQWAMEIGDMFPSARVTGIDLSPVQPVWVPPNVEFVVDDIEDNVWGRDNSYDYIHLRMTACILKDPVKVTATALSRLKPGGWIEFQEIYPALFCDDGSMPADYAPMRLYELLNRMLGEKSGFNIYIAEQLPRELERLGFTNIQRRVFKIPIGPWAKNRRLSMAGYLFRIVITGFMAAFAHKAAEIGLSPGDMDELMRASNAAMDEQWRLIHAYIPFHFVWAQKPCL